MFIPSRSFILCMVAMFVLVKVGSCPAESYDSVTHHFALDIKFGAYSPLIDSSKSTPPDATPFSDQFGDPNDPKGKRPYGLITQFEFDYQFLHHKTGSLAIGVSSGYFRKTGHPLIQLPKTTSFCTVEAANDGGARVFRLPSGVASDSATCLSADSQTLSVFPLSLLLVYRFEYLENQWHIPIIPFIRAGFGYWFWWFGNDNSFVSSITVNGTEKAASGGSFGVVFHPGIAIDLSGIDTDAGKTMEQQFGIHRVHAFIEMNGAWMNNFGLGRALNLSDISFNAGLGFEF